MTRHSWCIVTRLTLLALALSGCSAASSPTPTAGALAPATQAARTIPAAPTAAQVAEPATARPPRAAAAPTARPAATSTPAPVAPAFSYPIGAPGTPLGDRFFIRHGVGVENTWYNPGYWHTGEDWYAVVGDTAGAQVYAIADGEVVYAGANYPGRVVILRHAGDLFSMYGHLDPGLQVHVGQLVARGALLGTVLRRGDKTPNHLHVEVRTFLTAREVNGARPRYGFRCGLNCPPGPGYWPIDAPDLPGDRGWRIPAHVIARRMAPPAVEGRLGEVIVATRPVSPSVTLWSAPPGGDSREARGRVALHAGERFPLLALWAGPENSRQTSALAYQLWYRIRLADGKDGWAQAAVPSTFETGGDGRPSSVLFNFFPAVEAASS